MKDLLPTVLPRPVISRLHLSSAVHEAWAADDELSAGNQPDTWPWHPEKQSNTAPWHAAGQQAITDR